MKKKFALVAGAFLIGVGIVGSWLLGRSVSFVEVGPRPHDCYRLYVDDFDATDYKGVPTRRVQTIDANRSTTLVTDEEGSAEATADLYKRFREIPLTRTAACVDESYRLTWIPTFHAPTVIRVWRSADEHFIVIKRLNGKGGYDLGELGSEQSRALTAEEWQSLKHRILRASFWETPAVIEEPLLHDGAEWMFEGFSGEKYHSVFRIMPSNELGQLFRRLFELTGVETEYERYLSSVPPNNSFEANPGRRAFRYRPG